MTRMNKFSLSAALIGVTLAGAALAQSTGKVSALKGHNSNAPVDVSTTLEVLQSAAILTMVVLGGMGSIWGAMLAALPKAPSAYTPRKNPQLAVQRHRRGALRAGTGGITLGPDGFRGTDDRLGLPSLARVIP